MRLKDKVVIVTGAAGGNGAAISAYNVTKTAVVSFAQNLARNYAPDKIRVNAV